MSQLSRLSVLMVFALLLSVQAFAADNYRMEEQIYTLNPDGSRTFVYKEIIHNESDEKITEGTIFMRTNEDSPAKIHSWTDLQGRKIKYTPERRPRGFKYFYEYPEPIDQGDFGGFIIESEPTDVDDFFRVGDIAVFNTKCYSTRNMLFTFKLRLPKGTQIVKLTPEIFAISQVGEYLEISFRKFYEKSVRIADIHCEFIPGKEALNALDKVDEVFHSQKQFMELKADLSAEFHVSSREYNSGKKPQKTMTFRNTFDTLIDVKDDKGRSLKIRKEKHPDGNGFLYTVDFIDQLMPGDSMASTGIFRSDHNVYRWGADKICIIRGPHTPIPPTDYRFRVLVPKGARLVYSLFEPATIMEEDENTIIEIQKHLGLYEAVFFAIVLDVPGVDIEKLKELPQAEESVAGKAMRFYAD